VVRTDRSELTIADRLTFAIEATVDEAYEVELPRLASQLESFGIVDFRGEGPVLVDKARKRLTRTYVLEPFLSGEYTIPAMKVAFWKHDAAQDRHELETEPLTLKVRSLLPEAAAGLKIHDVLPPVPLPRRPVPWTWVALAVAVLAALAAAVVLRRRRRAEPQAAARIPPAHEIAFGELQALVAEKLAEQGEIKRFYQRLSDILRRYIERRFGLHAPEQTTEEFLAALHAAPAFPAQYRSLLAAFMNHCDLVKFAEHRPQPPDVQRTFDSCKAFIVGTGTRDAV
jgi:hypothetical protein